MQTTVKKTATNINKYVPPSKKQQTTFTQKKEPKKEFSLNANETAFPALNQLRKPNNLKPLLSFANAAKTQIKQSDSPIVSDVIPGWVHIRNNNGKIEYKYGKPTNRYPCSRDNFENIVSRIVFNNRLAKEQYERDNDINRLGDLSEYYGEKTIYEMFLEEERLLYVNSSDNSSSSDTEYETHFDTYENNKFEINTQ
jgi:hypothetical protein